MAPALASHYAIAGLRSQAGEWWVHAGDSAHARYAHEEALAYYQRALPFLEGGTAALWERIGRLHRRYLGRYAAGGEAYEHAIALRRQGSDWAAAVRDYCELTECRREMGAYEGAVKAARAALALAQETGAGAALLALGHIRLSNALRSGQLAPLPEIRAHLEAALVLAEDADAPLYAAEAHFWLGVLAYNGGAPEQALAYVRRALPAFRRSEQVGWETMALNNLAYYALRAGRPALALRSAEEGLALARRAGTVNSEIWLMSTLGQIRLHQGELDEAEVALQQGLVLAGKHGPERLRIGFHHLLALVALARQEWAAAAERIEALLAPAEQARPQHMTELHLALARAYLGQGETALAATQAEAARQDAVAKKQRSREGQAWRLLGRLAAAEGRTAEANGAFDRSLTLLETAGDRLERARTLAVWGHWQRALGEEERAGEMLAKARAVFVDMGALLDNRAISDD
jgi:tetratricopeptide (TPR) repeat protein